LQRLIDEFGLTHQQAADAVGRSRPAASNLLRLLQLTASVQELLASGKLDMGHARALLSLQPTDQLAAARRVVAGGLTVRQTETLARKWPLPDTRSVAARPDADIARLEEDLSNRLGTAVDVRHGSSGSGRLVIHYTNLEVLEGILERIR
jgi:ParB family chromosome partitioning protein